jgi:APA family basic amino acid/polyamine antiporter
MTACLIFCGIFFTICSVANGWSAYLVSLLQDFNINISPIWANPTGTAILSGDGDILSTAICNLPAMFIVAFMTFILYFGMDTSKTINAIIVIIKMLVLFLFIVLGAFKIDPQNWVPFIPENTGEFGKFGFSGILGGASIVFLAFNGFDTLATAAQEAKNPQRNIPIAIIVSLAISTITYVLVAAVLTGLVPYTQLNVAQPIALAVDKMAMPWFASFVKFGAVCGLMSVILVITYSLIRIIYTITKDGLLPNFLSICHEKYKTPHIATILLGSSASLISGIFPLENLVDLANFCVISMFILICATTLYLRYKEPNMVRGFRCPLMPWLPILGMLIFSEFLLSMPNKSVYWRFLIILAIGLLVYIFYGRFNSKLQKKAKNYV